MVQIVSKKNNAKSSLFIALFINCPLSNFRRRCPARSCCLRVARVLLWELLLTIGEGMGEGSGAGAPTNRSTGGTQSQNWALYSCCPAVSHVPLVPPSIIQLALGDLGTSLHPTPHLHPGCPSFYWYFPRGEVRAAADSAAQSSAHTSHILHPSPPPAFLLVFPQIRELPAPLMPRAIPSTTRMVRGDAQVRAAQHGGQDLSTQPRTAEPPCPPRKHTAGRASHIPGNTQPTWSSTSQLETCQGL